jgi:hypothetical protein
MARLRSWGVLPLLILTGSLAGPSTSRAGLIELFSGEVNVFKFEFTNRLGIGVSDGTFFNINYRETITDFSFLARTNDNFDFDVSKNYQAHIKTSLWDVNLTLNFRARDSGFPFFVDEGHLFDGSLTGQHVIAPIV